MNTAWLQLTLNEFHVSVRCSPKSSHILDFTSNLKTYLKLDYSFLRKAQVHSFCILKVKCTLMELWHRIDPYLEICNRDTKWLSNPSQFLLLLTNIYRALLYARHWGSCKAGVLMPWPLRWPPGCSNVTFKVIFQVSPARRSWWWLGRTQPQTRNPGDLQSHRAPGAAGWLRLATHVC